MNAVLSLIGGPLDGLYLPVNEATPPHQLIVFSPLNTSWTSYVDRRKKAGPTDVYKIKAGVRLSTSKPRDMKIIELTFMGNLSPDMVRGIEQIERERRAQEASEE